MLLLIYIHFVSVIDISSFSYITLFHLYFLYLYIYYTLFITFFFFFFSSRRRHTRYWRDWSSDVCSSDLCLAGHTFLIASRRTWGIPSRCVSATRGPRSRSPPNPPGAGACSWRWDAVVAGSTLSSDLAARRLEGIEKEHRPRHGTYAPGDGGYGRSFGLYLLKTYVTHQSSVIPPVNTDVYHYGAFLHILGPNHLPTAQGDDKDVPTGSNLG